MKRQSFFLGCVILALAACSERQTAETDAVADVDENLPQETGNATTAAGLPRTASVEGATVFFMTPADGATVSNPVSIEFGIEGMTVVKAGDNQPQSGHHHLLIDTDLPELALPIPADGQHIHFGDGSTATEVTLEPGEHALQLLLGDHLHIPHDPPVVSERITITVE